jgi:hypothetical protein
VRSFHQLLSKPRQCKLLLEATQVAPRSFPLVINFRKAKKALANAGLVYLEADVLCVELPNTPGALAKFTGKLAEKNINITMGYATGGEGSRKTTVVLAVSDLDKAAGIR